MACSPPPRGTQAVRLPGLSPAQHPRRVGTPRRPVRSKVRACPPEHGNGKPREAAHPPTPGRPDAPHGHANARTTETIMARPRALHACARPKKLGTLGAWLCTECEGPQNYPIQATAVYITAGNDQVSGESHQWHSCARIHLSREDPGRSGRLRAGSRQCHMG
jgi:hypothetical protein